jgi:hypothetical protein
MIKVRTVLSELQEMIRYALEHQTPVISMIRAGFRWINEVKLPVSEMSNASTEPMDNYLPSWTGDAATAYKDKALRQRAAIDEA